MKKSYLILLFCLPVLISNAQFMWAKAEGLWAYDYGYGVSTDVSGNVYVAGKYELNANFSGSTLNCQGNHDLFLVKYAPDGNLLWSRTAGGELGDYAHSMCSDRSHYVYVAGEIEGMNNTITFQNSTITLTGRGDNDVVVAKYDLDGNLLWAQSDGWIKGEKALGVSNDAAGNVYICGYFHDTISFGGAMHNGAGDEDIFIAKYNSEGALQWVRYAGSPGRDEARSIKCDADGNIYVCGLYCDGCNFSGTLMNCTAPWYEAFLAKYAPDGTLIWVRRGGGDYDDVAWSLTIDNSGKVIVGGEFNGYAVFGAQALVTSGRSNAFVVCYDGSGNVVWAKGAGGPLDDLVRGIGCDGDKIYVTGQFGATANFDSYSLNAADSSDIFIAALNNTGSFLWATSVGGSQDDFEPLGYESGIAVWGDPNGVVYATGALLNGGTFGGTSAAGYGRTDAFVAKISDAAIGFPEHSIFSEVSMFPNPVNGNLQINAGKVDVKSMNINVYNQLGQVVKNCKGNNCIDMSSLVSGVYTVELQGANQERFRQKVILKH